jgi:hypothetical protein
LARWAEARSPGRRQNDAVPWLAALDIRAPRTRTGRAAGAVAGDADGAALRNHRCGAIGEAAIADHTAVVVAKKNALAAGVDRLLGDTKLARRIMMPAKRACQVQPRRHARSMEAVFSARSTLMPASNRAIAQPDAPVSSVARWPGASRRWAAVASRRASRVDPGCASSAARRHADVTSLLASSAAGIRLPTS